MKLLFAIITSFLFFSKSIFAVTWDEARNTTLPFLKTVTELSALLHVCEEYDLSIKSLGIVNETIEVFFKQKVIDTNTAIDLKTLITLHNDKLIKEISSKGVNINNCNTARASYQYYANQRIGANQYLDSHSNEPFDLNLTDINLDFSRGCIKINIKNKSSKYLKEFFFVLNYLDTNGEVMDFEEVGFFNTVNEKSISPNTIADDGCLYLSKLSKHISYLEKNNLIYDLISGVSDDYQYINNYIDYKVININVNGVKIENFDNQIKTKIGIKPKPFINKIKITPSYEKKCIRVSIRNELDHEISPKEFFIIFKNTSGEIVDYSSYGYIYRYNIPSNFSAVSTCMEDRKYEKFVKKLKKQKLITKKLEKIEDYVEIQLVEVKIEDTYIEIKN